MKKIQLVRISSESLLSPGKEGMHGEHFLEFVQMMLCHAWFVGFLDDDLWNDIPIIAEAAALHDIGKKAVPRNLIHKKEKLTPVEYEAMKMHTIWGTAYVETLAPEVKDPRVYEYARGICLHHHERVDGFGYPAGLCGDEIPPLVQVISLADTYDALRSDRPYRRAFPHDEAVDMIENGECGAFDLDFFETVEPVMDEFWKLAHLLSEDPNWVR